MIKAVIAVVALVAAFAAGMAGVYYSMPMLAPGKVEKAQVHMDSLALVDSLAWVYSQGLATAPGSAVFLPDSLTVSPVALPAAAPSPNEVPVEDEAPEEEPVAVEEQVALQDSLAAVQRQFEQLMREQQRLLEEVKSLKDRVDDREAHSEEVQALSGTLSKLEDKELAGVVERLDMGVLEALYEQASARNRTRLLQAMPPEAAARFVRRLVQPNKTAANTVTAPPDTAAALPAAVNQPESLNE